MHSALVAIILVRKKKGGWFVAKRPQVTTNGAKPALKDSAGDGLPPFLNRQDGLRLSSRDFSRRDFDHQRDFNQHRVSNSFSKTLERSSQGAFLDIAI